MTDGCVTQWVVLGTVAAHVRDALQQALKAGATDGPRRLWATRDSRNCEAALEQVTGVPPPRHTSSLPSAGANLSGRMYNLGSS